MTANICGLNVKRLREEQGLGQVDLAASLTADFELKIDQSDISEIERRVRGVKDFELKAMAELFDVSVDSLLEE